MSTSVVSSSEQLVITVIQEYKHRPNNRWFGCLEIERKDYSYADILKLANDAPETIDRVLVIKGAELRDITDEVLTWAEKNEQ